MNTIATPLLKLLALSVLVCSAAGCITFPTKIPEQKPFKDEALGFIEVGKTTKKQVAAEMSNLTISDGKETKSLSLTPKRFNGGDWWLYTQGRDGWKWVFCFGGQAGVGCGGTPRTYRDYLLLIKFDDQGVVSEYELSSEGGNGCNPSGVCTRGAAHMLLAPEEHDDLVKSFQPPNDGCSVFMYAKVGALVGLDLLKEFPQGSNSLNPFPVEVALDDDPAISLIDNEGFLHWRADRGQHQIKIAARYPIWGSRVSEIDCQQGDMVFVKYSVRRTAADFWLSPGGKDVNMKPKVISFDVVENSDGRRDIKKRRLVMMY